MKVLDAGKVLPDELALDLVSRKLASDECRRRGWVLDGLGTATGSDELERAIVTATEEVSIIVPIRAQYPLDPPCARSGRPYCIFPRMCAPGKRNTRP